MSLLLFLVGAVFLYYLYVSYSVKPPKQNERTGSFQKVSQGSKQKLSLMFKAFLNGLDGQFSDYGDGKHDPFVFRSFVDRFQTFEDVTNAMRDAGVDQCQVIIGIDFTASNEWQGRTTNHGFSLHNVTSKSYHNPYLRVITVLKHTLKDLVYGHGLHDGMSQLQSRKQKSQIHAFGFGDSITKDQKTFTLRKDGLPCQHFDDVLASYRECATRIVLGGPTSYAPVIYKAINIVEHTKQFHLLVIIADGQFVDEEPTAKAIVAASFFPLSIVVVGVGDGPWDILHSFDDWLPQRQFDNFQFVEYTNVLKDNSSKSVEASLALQILMEVPDQYKMVERLGYIDKIKELSELKALVT